jgi:hypothetical protein
MMAQMSLPAIKINQMILDQLGRGEMRLLVLIVAVRKAFGGAEGVKGDLSTAVKSALRKLVTSKVVVDVEGVYSLTQQNEKALH